MKPRPRRRPRSSGWSSAARRCVTLICGRAFRRVWVMTEHHHHELHAGRRRSGPLAVGFVAKRGRSLSRSIRPDPSGIAYRRRRAVAETRCSTRAPSRSSLRARQGIHPSERLLAPPSATAALRPPTARARDHRLRTPPGYRHAPPAPPRARTRLASRRSPARRRAPGRRPPLGSGTDSVVGLPGEQVGSSNWLGEAGGEVERIHDGLTASASPRAPRSHPPASARRPRRHRPSGRQGESAPFSASHVSRSRARPWV